MSSSSLHVPQSDKTPPKEATVLKGKQNLSPSSQLLATKNLSTLKPEQKIVALHGCCVKEGWLNILRALA